jgi:hypothetical protein
MCLGMFFYTACSSSCWENRDPLEVHRINVTQIQSIKVLMQRVKIPQPSLLILSFYRLFISHTIHPSLCMYISITAYDNINIV